MMKNFVANSAVIPSETSFSATALYLYRMFEWLNRWAVVVIFSCFFFLGLLARQGNIYFYDVIFSSNCLSGAIYCTTIYSLFYSVILRKRFYIPLCGTLLFVIGLELYLLPLEKIYVILGNFAFLVSLAYVALQSVQNVVQENKIEKNSVENVQKIESLIRENQELQGSIHTLQKAFYDQSQSLKSSYDLYLSLKKNVEASQTVVSSQKELQTQQAYLELKKQYLHAEGKYKQLQAQFVEQKELLDATRKELFIVQGREIALSNKFREYESVALYSSLHEIAEAFQRDGFEED